MSITKNTTIAVATSMVIGTFSLCCVLPAHAAFGQANTNDLDNRVSRLETMLQNQLNVDNLNKVEALQQEIQKLQGRIEEQDYQIKLLTKKQFGNTPPKNFIKHPASGENTNAIDSQVKALDREKTKLEVEDSHMGNKVSISAKSVADEEKYNQAYSAMRTQDFENASILFSNFLWKFPDSKYVPDVYFWLGEINLNKWQQDNANEVAIEMAELSFNRLVKLHNEHSRAKDAMLKLGIVAELRGNMDAAKDYYEQVVDSFPNTPAASVAKNKLDRL